MAGQSEGREDEEGESGSGSEDEEVPQLVEAERPRQGPVVDEDGFTLVQGKGKGRRS